MTGVPTRVVAYMAKTSVPQMLGILRAFLRQHPAVVSLDFVIGDRSMFRWASRQRLDPRMRLHYQHERLRPFADRPLDRVQLAELEARYGLPHLWRYIMAQRFIEHLSEARKLGYLRAYLEYFEDLVKSTRAELFITGGPDSLPFMAASEVFRRNGVLTIAMAPGRLPRRLVAVADEVEQIPGLAAAYEQLRGRELTAEEAARVRAVREPYMREVERPPTYQLRGRLSAVPSPGRILAALRRRWIDDDRYFDFSLAYYMRRSLLIRLRRPVQRLALTRFARREVGAQPYFYMPLNYEPECAVDIQSGYFRNQEKVLERVVAALPVNYELYVKEHPNMLPAARPLGFYRRLGRRACVRLLPQDVDSYGIVKRSAGVITIGGTTGLEALFHGKPVVLLGHACYDVFREGVFRAASLEDVAVGLRWMADGPHIDPAAFDRFVAALLERSHPGVYELPAPGAMEEENVEAIARAISAEIAYLRHVV